MSLSPLIGAASQVLSLFAKNPVSGTGSNASSASSGANAQSILDSSGNVDLSQAAQVFSQLQNLSQSNPSQFKQLTAKISAQLESDAQQAAGSAQTFLSNLSNQFQTASQTGSAAGLQTGTHTHSHTGAKGAYDLISQAADAESAANGSVQNIYQQLQSL